MNFEKPVYLDVQHLENMYIAMRNANDKNMKEKHRAQEALETLAKSCEWYADKGTDQERHHFLKVEAMSIYLDAVSEVNG